MKFILSGVCLMFLLGCASTSLDDKCYAKDFKSCNKLAISYDHNKEYIKAKELYQMSCDGDYYAACGNLGILYYNGNGVKQDYDIARKLWEKACDGKQMNGCNNLGVLYEKGLGCKQDIIMANKLYKKACDNNFYSACGNLGALYYNNKDYSTAKHLWEKACSQGKDVTSCYSLGYLYKEGLGVRQNKTKAKEYYGKVCDLGEQKGCDNYKLLN